MPGAPRSTTKPVESHPSTAEIWGKALVDIGQKFSVLLQTNAATQNLPHHLLALPTPGVDASLKQTQSRGAGWPLPG